MEVQTVGSDTKRTIVSRSCYAATDVTDAARVLPRQREPGMKYENRDVKLQTAKASVAGRLHLRRRQPRPALPSSPSPPSSYTGRAELERKKKGAKTEKVSSTLSGKWVEACTK